MLQTLALVQKHADDPQRVTALARRQERELRRWLYGSGFGSATTLGDALAEAVADVEEAHGVRIELASSGDAPLDEPLSQLVLAAREALTNAAKHSGATRSPSTPRSAPTQCPSSSATAAPGSTALAVAPDRRGIADSVEARMQRAGGTRDHHLDARRRNRGRADDPEGGQLMRIVLVDDHELFRAGVRGELGERFEIVGEAGSVDEAVPLIRELDPDVVLLDVHLPDGGGEAVIAAVAPGASRR